MEVTTSLVGARWLQVQFLVSFSGDSKGRRGPTLWVAFSRGVGSLKQRHALGELGVVDTDGVRVWPRVVDLKPCTEKLLGR